MTNVPSSVVDQRQRPTSPTPSTMRLLQIPFSHNCIKVRRALELKGLPFEIRDIAPLDRAPVFAATGQGLVPALVDGDRSIADSTAILRYLEEKGAGRSLLPEDPAEHPSCWLIEDWADTAFMELTRRLAYWQRLRTPEVLAARFFPQARGLKRWVMMRRARQVLIRRFRLSAKQNESDEREAPRVARLALDRLAGRPRLFGDHDTVADITLAAMVAPLHVAAPRVQEDPAVRDLLAWARPILGSDVMRLYGWKHAGQ